MVQKNSASINGFGTLGGSLLGFVLFVGPVLLIVMNYIPQLDKYKKMLSVAIPAACVVAWILAFFQCKAGVAYGAESSLKAAAGAAAAFGADVKIKVSSSLGLGAILMLLSYFATAVAGLMTYHNFTLDKAGLEKLKNESKNLVKNVADKAKKDGE